MSLYKHILVATNLSEESKIVADRAKAMADMVKAKLSIIHVIELNPMMYGGGELMVYPINGDLEESVQNHAEQALQAEGLRLNIPIENQLLQTGITVDNLVDVIKNQHIDLLVLGHHEHHWLASVLGSISNSILHLMPCDVMAVHLS